MEIEFLKEFVVAQLGNNNESDHGLEHAMRVYKIAQKINAEEKCNEKIIFTAAIIHETVNRKSFSDLDAQNKKVEQLLKDNGYSKEEVEEIIYIINNSSYNEGKHTKLENQNAIIVRDAHFLDSIGAVVCIKTALYGAKIKRPFYSYDYVYEKDGKTAYMAGNETGLSHFYDKLFKLKDSLITKTAKKIAAKRHKFMKTFVEQFLEEI